MGYANRSDFERFVEGFGTLYYGTQSADGEGIVEIDISGYKLNRKYVAILVNAVNPTSYDCVGVSEFEVIGY